MTRILLLFVFAISVLSSVARAQAQQNAWVQIEAQPTLTRAQASLRDYAARLSDVNGFSIGGGWYAIALGPYDPDTAERVLRNLRAQGDIPRDSYIAVSADYNQQFWPIGANLLQTPALNAPAPAEPQTEADPTLAQPEAAQPEAAQPEAAVAEPADETPREARASEALLTRDEKKELQVALEWAGFYTGAIDAAFGRGTRNAMANWQVANGFEATGILTSLQRAALMRQYNAVLDGLGLRLVRDTKMGIEMKLPMGVVGLESYESPFAQYNATTDLAAKVLLISQEGDQRTLGGLFDIMQTLAIVPEDGTRKLEPGAFVLIGENTQKVSHTHAWLKDGHIKGFTLIWPAGDEERRTRLLGEMQESFARLDGVLPATAGSLENQSIDLVSGLEIRKPKLSRSGFYVDRVGTVVTTTDVVQSCTRITIDQIYDAKVVALDDASGIAVLQPTQALAPMSVAAFQMAVPRLQSDVAVAGYSYGGVLGAPTLTFGRLADVKGLNGEAQQKRLALNALDGDAGGPVVDSAGGVLGMLLPAPAGERQLPDGVSLAANADAVAEVLLQAGVTPSAAIANTEMAAERLTREAARMTVLVSCWD